jgi:thiol-disulfide isomerase/thioredoxin
MKKIAALIALCFLLSLNIRAQTQILKKFVDQVNAYKNITYTSVTNTESPLGDSADTIITYQNTARDKKDLQFEFVTTHNQDAFDGETLLMLDFNDKVYSTNSDYRYSSFYFSSLPLFKLFDVIKDALNRKGNIKLLPDTILNNTACFHIKISDKDTIVRKKRVYDIYDIYLNRATYLPLYAENNSSGFMEKGGVESSDVFKMVIRNKYTDYKMNQQEFPDIATVKAPAGFKSAEELNKESTKTSLPLLSAGTKAPDWILQDLDGKIISSNSMKNKVVLIDFFDSNCGPCIISIPVINRLHEKYKNSDVEIVSISLSDTRPIALKFANKFKMMGPICIDGRMVGDSFHVGPIPVFYLIDKQGNIASVIDGYKEELESDLTAQIDKLK